MKNHPQARDISIVYGGEVLSAHPAVAECAVIGMRDALKGEQPCGFIILKAGVTTPPDVIEKEVVQLVRDQIGPVAAFRASCRPAALNASAGLGVFREAGALSCRD